MLAVSMSNTSLAVALPELARGMDATPLELQWIVNAYTVTVAALIIPCGAWGDRIGPRVPLLFGSACLGVGSTLSAMAPGAEFLIASRVVMGVGAASLLPLSSSTVARMFPGAERSRAIATWAGVITLGAPLGLLIGGGAVQFVGWRAIFWANLPLVLVGALLTARRAPAWRPPKRPNVSSAKLATRAIGLMLLAWGLANSTGSDFHGASPAGVALTGLSLIVAASVGWRRADDATWPPGPTGRLTRRSYWCATLAAAMANLLVGVTFFLVPQISSAQHQADAGEIALVLLPGLAVGLIGNIVANRLRRRMGDPVVAAGGLGIVAICLAIAVARPQPPSLPHLGAWVALEGFGISLVLLTAVDVSLGCSVLTPVPGRWTAVTQTWRQMGGAVGVACCAAAIVMHPASGKPASGPVSPHSLAEATQTVGGALLVLSSAGVVYVLLALRAPGLLPTSGPAHPSQQSDNSACCHADTAAQS
ncbi:MFS transporter [Nocardioides lijunqiniae]|uniref:MFS transporter n=1 Tax=Nocardioides lijunqiniae TaxID=2760832 RepID=UPI003B8A66EC